MLLQCCADERIVGVIENAEMAERLNPHYSKSCYAGMYTRVQIPFSAPAVKRVSAFFGIARKTAFDHMADYRQLRLSIS